MARSLQFEAPTALDYFAALVAEDASLPVLEAAIAVAQDDEPDLDVQGELARIDALADRLRARVPPDAAPLQRLRLLNPYFFGELGFAGNVNDYYDPRNSSVPTVLRTRRGIPITLALLYIELAGQIGLKAHGVSFPGHFLIKVQMPRGEVVVDPFSGQSLGREALDERLLAFRQERGLVGDDEMPLALFLQPAAPREIVARLLGNLKVLHRAAGRWNRLLPVMRRLVILLPQDWDEHRDLALALAQVGQHAQAVDELALYLRHRPEASDVPALRRQADAWRRLQ